MTDLFGFLILASLIALVVGLIKPTVFSRFIKNPTRKKVGLILGGLFVVFFIGFGMTTDTKTATKTPSEPTPQTQQATTAPEPTKETKPLTTTDKLWVALDSSMKTRDGYTVEYDESSKTASVTKTSTDFWDETSMVRGSFTTLVKFGTEAFKIDGVEAVRVVTRSEFTDQYGKKGVDDAVRIIMNKSEFSKFDWNNLKYQSVYSQIKNASEGFYIHPAVLKNLDTSKLYLSL